MDAHLGHMASLRATGIVGDDTIKLLRFADSLLMVGQIGCKGNIVITVEKLLAITDEEIVQTVRYSYQATIRNGHKILRYDNQHAHHGHADDHHKHVFNFQTGDELANSPHWIGVDGWPTLSDVIREIAEWHHEHYDELTDAETYAKPEAQAPRLTLGFETE
jgi:hypothetical protein